MTPSTIHNMRAVSTVTPAAAVLLLLAGLHTAAAYPDSVDMHACEGHPTEEETREHHWSIYDSDVRTAFQVYVPDADGDLQLREGTLCAGVTHTIVVRRLGYACTHNHVASR